ncbi:MAG: hypothetical protein NTY61_02065, partial [Candidatus Parcubacteria bacterium]|nr:hypothetical protein [Candidatus Parcubacteria bacterium]
MRKLLIIIAIILVIAGIVLYLISRSKNQSSNTPLNNTPTALNNSTGNVVPTVEIDPFLQQ